MNSLKHCSDERHTLVRAGISMPLITFLFLVATCITLAFSCGPSREKMEYKERSAALADSVAAYMPGLATDTIYGVTHNFVRSATLKCKVKHVLATAEHIEELVSASGGYTSGSYLSSDVQHTNVVRFKKDSVMGQSYYTATATMTLRIPNHQLDSVLRQITTLAVFVDYRTLKADDVKLKLAANALAEKRLQHFTRRVEAKTDAGIPKLDQAVAAEEKNLEKQTAADEARIHSYDLADQVNYSTLALELYESQRSVCETAAVPAVITPYEPPFSEKFGAAFLKGFDLLKAFILFLAGSWSVLLIVGTVFVCIRYANRWYKKQDPAVSK